MKNMFLIEAAKNNVLPLGGGLWIVAMHPEQRICTPYKEWSFTGNVTRMPEFTAPKLGNTPNLVTINADIPATPTQRWPLQPHKALGSVQSRDA